MVPLVTFRNLSLKLLEMLSEGRIGLGLDGLSVGKGV